MMRWALARVGAGVLLLLAGGCTMTPAPADPNGEAAARQRYDQAMRLIEPHLTWHLPCAAPGDTAQAMRQESRELQGIRTDKWQEAHTGEPWMTEKARRALGPQLTQPQRVECDDSFEPFWRLSDPKHADIAAARALLLQVKQGPLNLPAQRWVAELERNNTVITWDVAGGYAAGQELPVVIDVRNADDLQFELYRVKSANDLLAAAGGVGEDFIFRDYGLQHGLQRLADRAKEMRLQTLRMTLAVQPPGPPALDPKDRVAQWVARVADLKPLGHRAWHDLDAMDQESDEEDGYFDDACERHRQRLEKSYRSETIGSWQCDRIASVPAGAIKEAGAYLLVARANGQSAIAPLLVEPLSLTMRRCRDGVFVLASDNAGNQAAAGAQVLAQTMMGTCTTDQAGAGFAKVFASGETPIVVAKDGRYAIGGFGRVFDGVYHSSMTWDRQVHRHRLERISRRLDSQQAHVYADRTVVGAYTDRPTYRPGDRVGFKMIIRKVGESAGGGQGFRSDDFDIASRLELLADQSAIGWELHDPRGRSVARGTGAINDFGTFSGTIDLSRESAVGSYALRVNVGGVDRLVPDVFAVKYYRRPTFNVLIVPKQDTMEGGRSLPVSVMATYYFGKPVGGAAVEVKLVHPEHPRPIAQATGRLDERGSANLGLALPADLAGGRYQVVARVMDESGETAGQATSIELAGKDGAAAQGLATLPRFAPLGQAIEIQTHEPITCAGDGAQTLEPAGGRVRFKPAKAGWYELSGAGRSNWIYVYGGDEPPVVPRRSRDDEHDPRPQWIDLDHADDWPEDFSPWRRPRGLRVLLGQNQVAVGQTLRVLVYAPYEKARLVFTMEGRTVMDYHTAVSQGPGPYHVVEIPITARHAPNFYLQGRLLTGQKELVKEHDLEQADELKKLRDQMEDDYDPRWCRIDVLTPRAVESAQTLKVEITPQKTQCAPGEAMKVKLRVTDLAGRPQAAELSLAAVDESVYSFGEETLGRLPQMLSGRRGPVRFMPKTWRQSVGRQGYDRQIMQEMQRAMAAQELAKAMDSAQQSLAGTLDQAEPIPGERPVTSIDMPAIRSNFAETAAWLPHIRTGPDGMAEEVVRFPDSLTAFRLSAVGLTRSSLIGIGRETVTVSKPLSVHVSLPRFAVHGDRLLVRAMVHNNTRQRRTVSTAWTISGATAEAMPPERIEMDANRRVSQEVWVKMDQIGMVSVQVRAWDRELADGEVRKLPVEPLGRAREVAMSGAVDRTARIALPAGFVARDLQISMSRKDPSAAMEGLAYLVDYPNGCVEQTMSRFLPAVAVQRAVRKLGAPLPTQVGAKLPRAIEQGLGRLYNFQHPDGGWGWWEKDQTNPRMTVYVLEGLARCRLADVAVDAGVLQRGCDHVLDLIRGQKLDAGQTARAWLALAMAGRHRGDEMEAFAKTTGEKLRPEARCELVLALHHAGRARATRELYASLTHWRPTETMALATLLETRLALNESMDRCFELAYLLLDLRQGPRWESTHATAVAIEALADLIPLGKGRLPVRGARILVGGQVKAVFDQPGQLEQLTYSVKLAGEQLPAVEALPIELQIDCDQPVQYSILSQGTQRLDKMQASGDAIRVTRTYQAPDGTPLDRPLGQMATVVVQLTLELEKPQQYVMLEDRRPAGFEYVADQLIASGVKASHVEFRDDRMVAFFAALPAGRHRFLYYMDARTPGTSHILPASAFPMYNEKVRGDSDAQVIEVNTGGK